jgi:hypothetical protein
VDRGSEERRVMIAEIAAIAKEITEVAEKSKFADCPLGKAAKGKTFDKPMTEYDKPLVIYNENLKNCPVEKEEYGHWEGERGNSKWIPDTDYVPSETKGKTHANPDNSTMKKIMDKYGIDGVAYEDGEPDFSKVSRGTVEIKDYSDSRSDNFDKADIELAKEKGCSPEDVEKWRKENNYTWHECKDMKTMQKAPNEIHANFSHSGGISEIKKEAGNNNEKRDFRRVDI